MIKPVFSSRLYEALEEGEKVFGKDDEGQGNSHPAQHTVDVVGITCSQNNEKKIHYR